jgi:site-specific DNA-methyltransferase (adenine-specific)
VVLGPDAAAELDRQSGTSTSPFIVGRGTNQGGSLQQRASSWGGEATEVPGYGDSGGASRFFPIFRYEPKAPTSERPRVGGGSQSSIRNPRCLTCGRLRLDYEASRCQCAEPDWSEVAATTGIAHPTVKPLSLVRWLCRLVCPPGGVILDPFAGSGTTGEAAILEHKRAILIEREADYLPLIVARLSKPMALGFDLDGEAS